MSTHKTVELSDCLNARVVSLFRSRHRVGDVDTCWLWAGQKDRDGYGVLKIRTPGARVIRANRIAWTIANGDIPSGLLVCHRCDNRACVNHHHLFVGTNEDNLRDMWEKQRARVDSYGPAGAGGPTKLYPDVVRAIREFTEMSAEDWAKQLGVSVSCVDAVRRRKTWRHVR